MAVSWPENLPFFCAAENDFDFPADNIIRSQPSVGAAKTRRRSTVDVPIYTGETRPLNKAQVAQLISFFRGALAGGALPFEAINPATGVTETFRIVDGLQSRGTGNRRIFSASLEVLP